MVPNGRGLANVELALRGSSSPPCRRRLRTHDEQDLTALDDRLKCRQWRLRRTIHHAARGVECAPMTWAADEVLLLVPAERTPFVGADGQERRDCASDVHENERIVLV